MLNIANIDKQLRYLIIDIELKKNNNYKITIKITKLVYKTL